MAEFSPFNAENIEKICPYKILNHLAMRLKTVEGKILEEWKFYEPKISNTLQI